MPDDTVTFAINGEISIDRFAAAVRRFADLLSALHSDVGERVPCDWILTDLQYSSAIATAQAKPKEGTEWSEAMQASVDDVIRSYLEVGNALQAGEPIPFTDRIEDRALKIKNLIDHDIESIRFETREDDVTVESEPQPQPLPERARPYAYGAVEGRVQALSSRGSLRFTLYDMIRDKAVSCYMMEGHEDQMIDVWGKFAVVEGFVRRDPKTGRALTVRNIRAITTLPESEPTAYRKARGAVPRAGGGERAEDVIRRLRDA